MLAIVTISVFACSDSSKKSKKKIVEKPKVERKALPQIPPAFLKTLFEKCEGIEVTYYDAPMSMSTNSSNTKNFIAFTRQEDVFEDQLQKRALGIMSFNVDGDIFMDAEFYADVNNSFQPYYKFMKDKKYYYNVMSPEGANVFTNPLRGNMMKPPQ